MRAYQGEVFGIAMYRVVADAQTDPWRRWQWECLHRLEVELRADVGEVLRNHGIRPEDDPAEVEAGVAEAVRIIDLPWNALLDEFAVDLPDLVDEYERLAGAPGFVDAERAVLRRLVRHEVVASEYCSAERAGADPRVSVAGVLALLREPPPPPED